MELKHVLMHLLLMLLMIEVQLVALLQLPVMMTRLQAACPSCARLLSLPKEQETIALLRRVTCHA
jgi:hypothetical protein